MGCGSGMSVGDGCVIGRRRAFGRRLHRALLERLDAAGNGLEPGGTRQRVCPGQKRGPATGPNPTDRGKPGTKRHLVTDARGTPLGVVLSGANTHDSTQSSRRSMRSRRCARVAADGRAAGPASCTPTKPTITAAAARNAGRAGSCRASRAGASRAVSAWAATVGWSSARWLGSPDSAAWPSATSAAQTSTSPSPPSPAHLVTLNQCRRFC